MKDTDKGTEFEFTEEEERNIVETWGGRAIDCYKQLKAANENIKEYHTKPFFTSTKYGMPLTYEKGDWDGERSDFVIVELDNGQYKIARSYSGYMDGSYFNDWYDEDDCSINREVVRWAEIPMF